MIRTKSRINTGGHDVLRTGRRAGGNDQHPPAWRKLERFTRTLFNGLPAILPGASDTGLAVKPNLYHVVFFWFRTFPFGPAA